MGTYWLLDRQGTKGPSVLVEADGAMRVIDVVRFGPKVTKLDDQQQIWDDVVGGLVPTMKPFVTEKDLDEEGVEVHEDLQHGAGSSTTSRTRSKNKRKGAGGARAKGGNKRTGGRGRG